MQEVRVAKQYDILIIGGGLVGASLLCALEPSIRKNQLKVGLIEHHDLSEPRDRPPSYDARASALSYGTRRIYDQLGLWSTLEPHATAIHNIHVSDRGHFGSTRLNCEEEKVPALGYVIENFRLGETLLERLKSYGDEGLVELISPAEVVKLQPLPEARMNARIRQLSSDQNAEEYEIDAELVVLADGGRSSLMDALCIHRKHYNYEQHALIANVTLDQSHKGVAYERFAGKGPMALLPLSEDRSALVWTVPEEQIEEKLALSDDAFLAELQQTFGDRAGQFLKVGKRDSYPLSLSVAQEQVRPGLVVLGNAAHAMHPVAGQGYNLAIRDTMALAKNIDQSLSSGKAIGNLTRLLNYVERQKSDQSVTLGFCDSLVKLFAREETSVIVARNVGLSGLNISKTLKSEFARKAMGL
ncbi:2-octaprenyl-6-methoxyphenyl hydroxylase [Endozoicomonas sp. OPT23]|uniref:2-octaprenyl-6-methoxyphenyl hydroxylase n=1 Tax=Endozoicomonas sp. OPT23 TaxID=2072845 RepID=UPI00129A67F2|nr:2-octaprenyl-6-methoxyphenyl hydroxylase [Endozoicomonas sp. OPT23]MRI32536.1 2-octaprenyl-6-methoxyphenyl hydroxylase [Endozoicomonas sp. OPT23]